VKTVIAPDSFKDSLPAIGVCEAMSEGVRRVIPESDIVLLPLADGGEGTVQAMIRAIGGRTERVRVTGPLGKPVSAEYGVLTKDNTAVVEMAAASGLELVPADCRNPMATTTFGTGELIQKALERGARKFIIGIGGSATTDCGAGAVQALGVRFFRRNGDEISEPMTGGLMAEVADVDLSGLNPKIHECEILAACDVENALLGERGAVMTFGRQKGASDRELLLLENGMRHFIGIVERKIGKRIRDIAGAGAAGGLGAGLAVFLGASLRPGIGLIMDACRFEEKIADADLVLTGEGKVDSQTMYGKAVAGVARIAKRHSVPVVLIAGQVETGIENLLSEGVTSVFSICSGPMPLERAMKNAKTLVADCTERVMRLFSFQKKSE
jgi:glycerate kinase